MGRSDYSTGGETRSSQRTHMDHFSVEEDTRCGSSPQRTEEELSDTVGSEQTDSECDDVAFQLYSVFDRQDDHSVSNSRSSGKRSEWQSSWFASKAEIAYQFEFLKSLAPKRRQQQSLQSSDHTPRTSNDGRSRRAASTASEAFEPEPILESYDMYDSQGGNAIYRTTRDGGLQHRNGGTSTLSSYIQRHDQPFVAHRADAHFGAYEEDDNKTQQHNNYGLYADEHQIEQLRLSQPSNVSRNGYNDYFPSHELFSERAQEVDFDHHTLDNLRPKSSNANRRYRTTDPGVVMYEVGPQDQTGPHSQARSPYETSLGHHGLYPVPAEINDELEFQHQQQKIDSQRRETSLYAVKEDIDDEFERMKARASEAMKRSISSHNKNSKTNIPQRTELQNQLEQIMRITETEPDHVTDLEHDLHYADKRDIEHEIEQMRQKTANRANTAINRASVAAEYNWRNPRSAQPRTAVFQPPAPLHNINGERDAHVMQGRTSFLQYREHNASSQYEDGKDELDSEFNRFRTRAANVVGLDTISSVSITSPQRLLPTGNSPLSPSAAAVLERLPPLSSKRSSPGSIMRMNSPRTEVDRHLRDTKAEIANQFDQLRSRVAGASRDNSPPVPETAFHSNRPFQLFNVFDGEGDIEGGPSPVKAEIENEFDQLRSRASMAQGGNTPPVPIKNEIDDQFAQLRTRSRNARVVSRSADIIRFRRPTRPGAVFVPWGGRGPPPTTLNTMTRRSIREETLDPYQEQECDQQEADPEEVANENTPAPEEDEQTDPADPPTPPSSNGDYPEAVPELDWTPKPRSYKVWAMPLLVIIVLSVTSIGVGVGVYRRRHASPSSTGSLPTTAMDLPTVSCGVGMTGSQPNVVTQCTCKGNITVVASDIAAMYEVLRNSFMKTVVPDFNATMDSCDPVNQALVWLSSATGTPINEARRSQRFALATMYMSWKGQGWISSKGWLSSNDECSWAGVSCNSNRDVFMIDLSNNNLRGELGSAIGLLTTLNSLSLASNTLEGTIPTELANLSLLLSLTLSANSLSGSIPSELGLITQITSIDLDMNNLVGTLPTELGLLSNLLSLSIATNELKGSIPTELGMLVNLHGISLQANSMTGTLPTEIGKWVSAQTINLGQNNFYKSTIPTEIGLITSLTSFVLLASGIQGTLPTELFSIQSLQDFEAQDNYLVGTLPTEIGQLMVMTYWRISNNKLTGSIPTEIGLCTRLNELMVGGNDLNGTIPVQLGLISLNVLELSGNTFSGSVPLSVCNVLRPLYCAHQGSSLQCGCCQCG